MRILHLAFEDPAQPGSGGGSIRTREINRRLAGRHQITAVVAGYPGARERIEDGIRWVPIGLRSGSKRDQLSYFALLGAAVRRHRHDLLVEDFGAPFSVGGGPLFTRRPVVASVQWLFAAEKRAEYNLPFDWVERAGLRLYHDFIAVSDWLADDLRARRPGAHVETIPNGVDDIAFAVEPRPPRHLLYVGRLETVHKGCDLLIEAAACAHAVLGRAMPPLVIVGDGPARADMEHHAQRLGVDGLITFRGRVEGVAKYRLMAEAYALLVPSRYETFGMVAIEGLAVGVPVIAFNVGPLAGVAGPGGAQLVLPLDVDAFAREVVAAVRLNDGVSRNRRAQVGRKWARQYNWDRLAERQEEHYVRAVSSPRMTVNRHHTAPVLPVVEHTAATQSPEGRGSTTSS